MHAPAAAAATEPSQELPADKQMIYAIVNEFLGTVTFNNPEAEASLVDRLPVLQSTAAAVATEHGRDLSRAEVTQIFRQYMEDLKNELRPDQLGKTWT